MKKAPKKLSVAMRIALNDLRKVERDPKYKVSMSVWHEPPNRDSFAPKCTVCFAGSVMAKTCELPRDTDYYNFTFPEDWQNVFSALNKARQGKLEDALDLLGRGFRAVSKIRHLFSTNLYAGTVEVTSYKENPVQWRKDMFKIVHELEAVGE